MFEASGPPALVPVPKTFRTEVGRAICRLCGRPTLRRVTPTADASLRPLPDARSRRPTPPQVAALGRVLLADLDALTERLVDAVLAEDPSYSDAGEALRQDLRRSCHDNLARVLLVLVAGADELGEGVDPFDAPRATGARRAEQGVPLESVLHAYRLGHRTIWEGLVSLARSRPGGELDVLVEAASVVWEVVDEFSSAVGDAYRTAEQLLARRDDRRREALVDALLAGRGGERSVAAEAAAALDLPERGRYVVVAVESPVTGRTANAFAVRGLRAAWRTRADREVGLVCLGHSSAERVVRVLEGSEGTRAGVSPVVEGLGELAGAARLAETALRALPPGCPVVGELDARLPGALLVTAPDLAARLVQRALGGVLALEGDEREVLLETLFTWLDTGGSAGQTASRLYCHRNTVLNRLRRLEALTGRSLERVDHLVEESLALLALRLLPDLP